MASYHYTLKTYSSEGSISIEGTVRLPLASVALEEFLSEVSRIVGEDLDPASTGQSNYLILINEMRVDWERDRKMLLSEGDRLTWITPPFGG